MGVIVEEGQSGDSGEDYEVWPENWDAVRAFLAAETQWRAAIGPAAMIWLGLDYAGLDTVLTRKFPAADAAMFDDLRRMEAEALAVFDEARP